jgi:UDP-N-acetylglucosamine--N-acetylmuramyl-(pentapeptide) pyrophosphoryl-undecaprenol N-acetylglucosamine transferase
MSPQREIWIACGGTGGHFMPGIVLGRTLERQGYVVKYWGEGKKVEESLCQAQNITMSRPAPGSRWRRLKELHHMMSRQAREHQPELALLCGGFSSLALGTWCLFHRIPFHLFEQNTVPGRVNRLLSIFATSAVLTFPLCKYKLRCPQQILGNPVRPPLNNVSKTEWDILILGGSQGAMALNQHLPKFIGPEYKVLHICGPGRLQEATEAWKNKTSQVEIRESDPNIPNILARCRWVITRSGATSLSEMAAAGSSVICVPYPHAKDDHQHYNAQALSKNKAAFVLTEAEIESKATWLNELLQNQEAQALSSKGMRSSGLADINGEKALKALNLLG